MTAQFKRLAQDEQHRAALPVLLAARKAVVLDGAQPIDAIQQAGNAGLACHWARQLLLDVVPTPTLQQWQLDPSVLRSDRTRAFDRAIRTARHAFGHRGGWSVSGCLKSTPPRPAAERPAGGGN